MTVLKTLTRSMHITTQFSVNNCVMSETFSLLPKHILILNELNKTTMHSKHSDKCLIETKNKVVQLYCKCIIGKYMFPSTLVMSETNVMSETILSQENTLAEGLQVKYDTR